MKSFHHTLLAALTMTLCARLAPAEEVYAPSVMHDTVTLAPWAPTAQVSAVTVTNGGAFGSTGVVYYALQPQNRLGLAPLGPVTSATVTATGQLVRIRWAVPAGATNVLVWRGSTTNLGSYVSAARLTNIIDYGTNAWSTGAVAVTATSVVELILIGDSTSPNAAISRAQALAIIGLTNALTTDDVFGGDVAGAFGDLQLGTGVVGEAELSADIIARLDGGPASPITNRITWSSGIPYDNFGLGLWANTPIARQDGIATNVFRLAFKYAVEPWYGDWAYSVFYDGWFWAGRGFAGDGTWVSNVNASSVGGVAGSNVMQRSGGVFDGKTTIGVSPSMFSGYSSWGLEFLGYYGNVVTNTLAGDAQGLYLVRADLPGVGCRVIDSHNFTNFLAVFGFMTSTAGNTNYLRNTTAQPTNFAYAGAPWQVGWQNIAGVTTQRLFVMHDGTGWYYQVWNRMPAP